MDPISHARSDYFDHDATSQWVGKGKKNHRCMLSAIKQAISIKLATKVGHFLCDLDLANVCPDRLDQLVFNSRLQK